MIRQILGHQGSIITKIKQRKTAKNAQTHYVCFKLDSSKVITVNARVFDTQFSSVYTDYN